jgi:hypothetical protein
LRALLLVALGVLPFLANSAFAQDEKKPESIINLERTSLRLNRGAIHEWDRWVRGFRREHNFSLVTGVTSGIWEVNRFGTVEASRFASEGLMARFQYSSHLQIWRGFGYFLGSGAGYVHERSSGTSAFQAVPAVQFPGILTGLVLNVSPAVRFGGSLEAWLERLSGLRERDGVGKEPKIHITMESWNASLWFDGFYSLHWAVRVEAHWRRAFFRRPASPEGKAVDVNIWKADRAVTTGLVYHFL